MFIKVHHHLVVTEHPAVVSALKYEAWAVENRSTGAEDINHNQFRWVHSGRRRVGMAGWVGESLLGYGGLPQL